MPRKPRRSAPVTPTVIHLSEHDQRVIAEAILNPQPPSDALKRAVEAHARLISGNEA